MQPGLLDKLLITLAVRLHAFAVLRIAEGWRLRFDPMRAVTVHYVLAGSGELRSGTGVIRYAPGWMLIVPAGVTQSLGTAGPPIGEAAGDASCRVVDDGLVAFSAGMAGQDIGLPEAGGTLAACGTISATYAGALGLFDHLPGPVAQDTSGSFDSVFRQIAAEVENPRIGTQALTEALMKQCLVLLLREQLARVGPASPLFASLQDPRLARALSAVLARPAAPHTVDSLATVAGMGRSAFAEAFVRAYGQPPLDFVQKARLRLAAQLLGTTDLPVKVIAGSIGYASRSYFSRAFRATYGTDPTTYRDLGGSAEVEPEAVEGQGVAEA